MKNKIGKKCHFESPVFQKDEIINNTFKLSNFIIHLSKNETKV